MSTADDLLRDILAFCARYNLSETAFGAMAVRDRHLVRRLRGGKSMTVRRLDQVREFMRSYETADLAKDKQGSDGAAAQPAPGLDNCRSTPKEEAAA